MRRTLLLAGAIAAALFVALGVLLLVNGIDSLGDTRLGDTRTSVGDEREISLEAQKYVIYYEVDDEFAPSGENGALADPVLTVTIRARDGSSLPIKDYGADFNVESGGRYAQGLSTVEPSTAGDYLLTAGGDDDGPENPAVVLGEPVSGRIGSLVAGIAALVAGFGLGVLVLIVALVGRQRARRASQGAGNPAPPGY